MQYKVFYCNSNIKDGDIMCKISDINISEKDFDDINKLNIIDNELDCSKISCNLNSKKEEYKKESFFNLLHILYVMASFRLNDGEGKEVFVNTNISINIFTKEQIVILYNNINKIHNLALKSRILDIIYESKKLPKESKSELNDILISTYFDLCSNYHKDDIVKQEIYTRLLALTCFFDKTEIRDKLISLSLRTSPSNLLRFYEKISSIKIASDQRESVINHLENFISHRDEKSYIYNTPIYDVLIKLDKNKQQYYKLEKAKNYENIAKISSSSPPKKSHWLKEAQKIYKEEGMNEEADRIQKEVNELKPLILEEFKCNVLPPEVTNFYEDAYLCLKNKLKGNLCNALYYFFNVIIFPSEDQINKEAEKLLTPRLFNNNAFYNDLGERTNYKNNSSNEVCMSNATNVWGTIIRIALDILNEEFFFTEYDVSRLIKDNRYCRTKIKSITKGIYTFLKADYITASYLLIPQIEEYLRTKLAYDGFNTSYIKNHGVEGKKFDLEDLITNCKDRELISSTEAFYLIRLLTKDYSNIRNSLTHGSLTDKALSEDCDIVCLLYLFTKKLVEHNFC